MIQLHLNKDDYRFIIRRLEPLFNKICHCDVIANVSFNSHVYGGLHFHRPTLSICSCSRRQICVAAAGALTQRSAGFLRQFTDKMHWCLALDWTLHVVVKLLCYSEIQCDEDIKTKNLQLRWDTPHV